MKKNSIIQMSPIKEFFGEFGGSYVAEVLVPSLKEMEEGYQRAINDPDFCAELDLTLQEFAGRPSPLYLAKNLTDYCQGAKIYFKREELSYTGSHKINNCIGQALLAKYLGKTHVIAETGAGQHGVATASVCAKLGLRCKVFMGSLDVSRQKKNVVSMKALNAEVIPVETGSKTLKDAINEAIRCWVASSSDTYYLFGSAAGPHPFPSIVADFQSCIGRETKQQILDRENRLPNSLVACVGGGSNSIGFFREFLDDREVSLYGIEAGGCGFELGENAAALEHGSIGILHGSKTMVLQDSYGQIIEPCSISAGLDYPAVGPQHAYLKKSGRVLYSSVSDKQAVEAFDTCCKYEGIIPAIEPSHALYFAMDLARKKSKDHLLILNMCGRGDKDIDNIDSYRSKG